MTQKELAYFEDAIGHENNIISILDESVKKLQDENLISFLNSEKEKHAATLQDLMNMLEGKVNE